MTCPECGWPGVGMMPAGVRQVVRDGKRVLLGQLTYFPAEEGPLCSVCRDMKWTVVERPWFVEAHREYLEQVKLKNKLMGKPRKQD